MRTLTLTLARTLTLTLTLTLPLPLTLTLALTHPTPGAIISYADMMKKQIVMPAELMCDGYENPHMMETGLYEDFSRVATDLNVYTGVDYADIIEHLNDFWQIEKVTGLGPEAQEAQEYLGKLPVRFRKLANRQQKQLAKTPRQVRPWPWINDREV